MLLRASPAMPAPETSAAEVPSSSASSARSAPSPDRASASSSTAIDYCFCSGAVGATMVRPRRENAAAERKANLATCLLTAAVAFLAGMASGFFGIGGGFLIVPGLMLAARMPMIKAVGSSLLAVGAFGLATPINYSLSGLVDWRIAGEFIAGGIVGGLAGMVLANRLSHGKDTLKRIFAVLIFIVAAYVLYRSGQTMMS